MPNELANPDTNNNLNYKNIAILKTEKVEDYLFIILENGQRILTNGKEIYDCSDYHHFLNIFPMDGQLCAVFERDVRVCVVNLNNMAVLFQDKKAFHISKEDERVIRVVMKVGSGKAQMYDIQTQKYLPAPSDYEFEHSLGNNLYVFAEENSDKDFLSYKRCVISADGQIILKDIEGWIDYSDNHLIITRKNEICIVKINDFSIISMTTIKQQDGLIAKPYYYDGFIILMAKHVIKICNLDLEPIREFNVADLEKVNDYEITEDILKIAVPYIINGEDVERHIFVNLKNGKVISHLRIEGYPFWSPTTFIGQDSMNTEPTEFHFYQADFTPLISLTAKYYDSAEDPNECMFIMTSEKDGTEQQYLLNAETGAIINITYDYIQFHHSLPYGFGINISSGKIEFFDTNLNIIIPGFAYAKFDIEYESSRFNYFLINDYLCIIIRLTDGPRTFYRYIILNASGKVFLDSLKHECYPMGNFIQIVGENTTQFLNTITGEISGLSLTAPTDETGKIDLSQIRDINRLFTSNGIPLAIPSTDEASKNLLFNYPTN